MSNARVPRVGQRMFDNIFGYTYTGLAVNICLIASNVPCAFLLMFARFSSASWPALVAASITVAPSLGGAFVAFHHYGQGNVDPFSSFWRGWVRILTATAPMSVAMVVLTLIVGIDLTGLAHVLIGPLLMPVLLMVLALATITTLVAIALLTVNTDMGTLQALRASLALSVRHPLPGLMSLVAVVGLIAIVLAQPVLGLLLSTSPLIYLVYGNSTYIARQISSEV